MYRIEYVDDIGDLKIIYSTTRRSAKEIARNIETTIADSEPSVEQIVFSPRMDGFCSVLNNENAYFEEHCR